MNYTALNQFHHYIAGLKRTPDGRVEIPEKSAIGCINAFAARYPEEGRVVAELFKSHVIPHSLGLRDAPFTERPDPNTLPPSFRAFADELRAEDVAIGLNQRMNTQRDLNALAEAQASQPESLHQTLSNAFDFHTSQESGHE